MAMSRRACRRGATYSQSRSKARGVTLPALEWKRWFSTSSRCSQNSRTARPMVEMEACMPGGWLIHDFLHDARVGYTVLPHRPAFTAQDEAAAAHVPGRD